MAKLLNNPFVRFFTTSGTLAGLSGGKLNTYAAGGTTPKATYTDSTEGTANDNPITMNSNGMPEKSGSLVSIWLASGAYKLVLTDSAENVIQTIDNVTTTGSDENITINNSDPSLTITDTDGTLSHVMGVSADTLTMKENENDRVYLQATGSVATFGYSSGTTVLRGPTALRIDDNISFGSSGEFEYASMYQHETENTITIATQNVFVKVTGLSAGLTSGNGSVATSAITVPAGKYKVDYSITMRSGSGSINAAASVFVNGVEQEATSTRMYLTAANLYQCFSGHGMIDVTDAAHEIDLRVKNITDTTNFNKTDVNFTVHQLAGT